MTYPVNPMMTKFYPDQFLTEKRQAEQQLSSLSSKIVKLNGEIQNIRQKGKQSARDAMKNCVLGGAILITEIGLGMQYNISIDSLVTTRFGGPVIMASTVNMIVMLKNLCFAGMALNQRQKKDSELNALKTEYDTIRQAYEAKFKLKKD